ncbi:MAG: hydrogenase maturation protease [Rhodospirillales bacterium]|nr:hydrogenase maturation protease [Rhodospirillales bacterium]
MKYLLIGYGNPLRSDDGVGCHVAGEFVDDAPALMGAASADVHVVSVGELAPELAEPVAQSERVVVVNASYGELPGEFTVRRVEPASEADGPASYVYDPATLAAWARGTDGKAPEILVVAVGAANCAFGQGLSPDVAEAVPSVLEKIAALFLSD